MDVQQPIRVLVDDQPVFLEAMRLFLEQDKRVQVIALAADGLAVRSSSSPV